MRFSISSHIQNSLSSLEFSGKNRGMKISRYSLYSLKHVVEETRWQLNEGYCSLYLFLRTAIHHMTFQIVYILKRKKFLRERLISGLSIYQQLSSIRSYYEHLSISDENSYQYFCMTILNLS